MAAKPPPKTVKEVIRSLIPPKEAKRGKKKKKKRMKTKTRKKSTPINFFKLSLETFQLN